MPDAAVSPPELERLAKAIVTEADESQNLEAWIGVSLKGMRDLCGRIEALHQVPGNADELVEKIRMVVRRLEDVNDTSNKLEAQIKTAAFYRKPIYWIRMRDLMGQIMKIRIDTTNALQQLQLPLKYNFTISDDVVMPGQLSQVSEHLNYRSIPFYLRQCIYYFLLFPANIEIPARRLIVLWVAEGLVSQKGDDSAEQVAGSYLNELIEHKVISAKKRLNGNVKSCQLTDGRRDALLEMAKEARFFEQNSGLISRLVDHNGTSRDSCFIHVNGNRISSAKMPNYRNVLSFLSFNNQEGSKPGEDIGDFLDKCISAGCFQLMRVLDLERVFRPKLPKALSKLTLLRYLGLRWTYLEHLPDFVNKLFNLQVLDVKNTYISTLPKSIWRMQYLRHLYLSEAYRTRFSGRPSSVSLNDLQTLWGAFIDEETCVAGGLDTLQNIRKLGLSCRLSSSSENSHEKMKEQLEAVSEWISKLKFLESLRLKSRDEKGKAYDLHLSSLNQNENLTTVYLVGRLQQSVVSEFTANLIEITLSGSELDEDPMISLGNLQNLLILRLLSQSVKHDTMICKERTFRSLKVLKIWKLENLKKWEAEEGSMGSLEELDVRSCRNLEKLPDRLQDISTLQKLRLKSMDVKFIDAIKENESPWKKIEHVLETD